MNENTNLCEILKGHEGETFYSPIYGNVILHSINDIGDYVINITYNDNNSNSFTKFGKFYDIEDSECLIFPSKDQRDWNKWIEEQKLKVPKTWNELVKADKNKAYGVVINIVGTGVADISIEKSALALFKIHQLIEVGYGGNITNEEYKNTDFKYVIFKDVSTNEFSINSVCNCIYGLIAFHTNKQAKEFLSKPENIQLLKDYFMVN